MRFTMAAGAAGLLLATALPALAQTSMSQGVPSAPPQAQTPPSSNANASAPVGPTSTALAVGLPVKDKTGVVIGSITELKPGAGGQTATVKMGDQTFAIGAQSFVVQNGAAVINATQDELRQMISNASKAG
jgi:hypothetical protein